MLSFKEYCIQEGLGDRIKAFHDRIKSRGQAKMGTHGTKPVGPIEHKPAPRDRNTSSGTGTTTLHVTDGNYNSGRSHAQSILDRNNASSTTYNKAERKRQRMMPPSQRIALRNKPSNGENVKPKKPMEAQ